MTDREALEYIRKGLTVNRFSPKWQKALELACNALEKVMLNTTEKPVRTDCDERKDKDRVTISMGEFNRLNRRFHELESKVEYISDTLHRHDYEMANMDVEINRITAILEEEGLWHE